MMPINNIQFRAENFNNIFHHIYFIIKPSLFKIIISCFKNFFRFKEYSSYIKPFLFHVICSTIFLIIFPIIVLFKLSFSNFFNLSNCFLEVYIFICISIRFIINLLRYDIPSSVARPPLSSYYNVTFFFKSVPSYHLLGLP